VTIGCEQAKIFLPKKEAENKNKFLLKNCEPFLVMTIFILFAPKIPCRDKSQE
jgi:hypothetical protein